jgi:predicted enzyme related to lactoylglutathione lyase
VHFEIPADDTEKLATFYSTLFGWKCTRTPVPGFDYWVCMTGEGPGIDGGIVKKGSPQHAVTNYVDVEDVNAALEKAKALGASVALPKTPVPGMGWFALAFDPQGNPFGLWMSDKAAH